MPNGGPNCTICIFNRPHREWCIATRKGLTSEDFEDNRQRTSKQAFCLVHNRPIENPYWTSCSHGTDMWQDEIPRLEEPIRRERIGGLELPVQTGTRVEAISGESVACIGHPQTRRAQVRLHRADGSTAAYCVECYMAAMGRPHSTDPI